MAAMYIRLSDSTLKALRARGVNARKVLEWVVAQMGTPEMDARIKANGWLERNKGGRPQKVTVAVQKAPGVVLAQNAPSTPSRPIPPRKIPIIEG